MTSRSWLAAFGVCALLSCSLEAGPAMIFGRVRGKPRVVPKADSGGAYSSRALRYATLFDYQNLKDVVVYVEASDPSAVSLPDQTKDREWDIRFEKYRNGIKISPAFLVVPERAKVNFKNLSPETITAYSGGDSIKRIRADIESGQQNSMVMGPTGLYRLHCLDDASASSKLFVAGSTFSVADPEGHYSLTLPAGKYKITAWHSRLPPQTQEIQLFDDKKLELDFTLSVEQLHDIK